MNGLASKSQFVVLESASRYPMGETFDICTSSSPLTPCDFPSSSVAVFTPCQSEGTTPFIRVLTASQENEEPVITQEPKGTSDQETVEISEPNEIGGGVSNEYSYFSILSQTVSSIGACIGLKKSTSQPQKNTSSVFRFDKIVKEVGEGVLDKSGFIGLKNSETGTSFLYDLSIKNPKLLEKWVDEEVVSIFSDLIDPSVVFFDDIGDSVLHNFVKYHIETIDKWVREGKLLKEHLSSHKNPITGRSLLHDIVIENPDLIASWVEDGVVCIEPDLTASDPLYFDQLGNSMLHFLAQHHPRIIDNWIREEKVSRQDLMYIRNARGLSVYFFIESFAPMIHQVWKQLDL